MVREFYHNARIQQSVMLIDLSGKKHKRYKLQINNDAIIQYHNDIVLIRWRCFIYMIAVAHAAAESDDSVSWVRCSYV